MGLLLPGRPGRFGVGLGAGGALPGEWLREGGTGRREFHNTLHETREIDEIPCRDDGRRARKTRESGGK